MNEHVIKLTLEIEFPYPVPEDRKTPEEIEDYFNNTRLCRIQLLDEVAQQICVCDETKVDYVRKATQEDINRWENGKISVIYNKSKKK